MLLNLCICIYPLLWKREDKRSVSVGGSVSTTFSQTEGRMNSMAAVVFFFFFIDVIFNCLQQRTGELNSKYIFYHVTRQKIRAARGNCKVKRSRWTTLKKKKKIFKEAGIQSNLSVVFRNWETQKLFQPPVVCCRLRRYTHYATAGLYTTHRGFNVPAEQIKINFYSTSPGHLIWFDFIQTQFCFLLTRICCFWVFAVQMKDGRVDTAVLILRYSQRLIW